ncbi:hypothetical protein SPAR_00220 [Streptomyces sparsogenes DSM 40356]|uniref:Uncharacterized protein n=1 Tax=Streptomyces sparsogenes DSM 40356 TaxID=1331668 RepID=A0A1R1STI8_9ACTN|nr:hypothetical protein SPAR_00220 [Streptomyces sparsogenes DSM 40356]
MSRRTDPTPMSAPLPEGWTYFRSKASRALGGSEPHWYATAPYHISSLPAVDGRGKLDQTVSAPTWAELHRLVAAQVDKYRTLMS